MVAGLRVTLDVQDLRNVAEDQLKLPADLHPYQWEGVAFLHQSTSALLADEMGLGKTVQAAVALTLLLNGKSEIDRALIVAPASLTLNWMSELATWAPSLATRRLQGAAASRKAFYLLPIPVLVSSYEQIRQDGLDQIPRGRFDLVILDEAQRIKNQNSATALACRLLPRKRAWALSATPLENDRKDTASILAFLDPDIHRDPDASRLKKRLETMMLRRRKREVRAELPAVIAQDLHLELSAAQRVTYDDLWTARTALISEDRKDSNTAMLGLITRLKLICNYDVASGSSSKLEALRAICEGAGQSARILVFSQFVQTLRQISQRIGIPHDLLIGSMSAAQRQRSIDQFRTGQTPRALLISLRAGGVGLNLGEATHTLLFDRWWNPAVEFQAVYRAHRFHREEPLHMIRFLIRDSVEERIAEVLDRKGALFDEIIESVEGTRNRLSKTELMAILELAEGNIPPSPHANKGD